MSTSTRAARTRGEGSDLTPEAAAVLRRQVPDSPIVLPPGSLACEACGCAVAHDGDLALTTATALARAGEPPRAPSQFPRPELTTTLTSCPQCHARRDTARRIVARFPVLTVKLGPFGAQHRVEAALNGLAALGMKMPDPDVVSPAVVGSLLARMSGPGAAVTFAGQLSPIQTIPPNACSPYPWAHLSLSARAALRGLYAGHLADKMAALRPAPDLRLTPPDPTGPGIPVPGGCALCGIGVITRSAAAVQSLGGVDQARREVWTPVAVDATAIGGPGSPERLAAHCCPDCSDAVETVGSTGYTAMARAFVRHLRSSGRDVDALKVERGEVRVAGWAAVWLAAKQRGIKPPAANRASWGHLR